MSLPAGRPETPSWQKLKYKLYPRTRDQKLIFVTLLFSLTIAVVMPVGAMVFFSFFIDFPVTDQFGFTLAHYAEVFSDLDLLSSIFVDSFVYAVGTALGALVIGSMAAIFVVKYVESRWVQILMLLPYGIPSVASLTGWILLLGNNGLVTNIVMNAFGLSEPPWNIYSMWGMIFVEALHTAPLAFLMLLPALRAIPAAMDDASFITGAGRIKTFRKVIIPIVWPSIISVSIFLLARALATITTPAVLGLPARIFTFGTAIPYIFLSGLELSYSSALAFAVLLTAITGVFILYYLKMQSKEGQYTTVTGRGRSEVRRYETSRTRKFGGYALVTGYLFVGGILPLLAVFWDSLLPANMLNLTFQPEFFSLENYYVLFSGERSGASSWWRALKNTLLLGLMVPTTAMGISMLVAYSNQMVKMPMGRLLSFLASLPLAIPGIARGAGFLAVFIMTPLWGSWWMLFVAFHGFAIPIGMRYASPALTRIGVENTEASLQTGARAIRTFRKIVFPLTSDDYVAGWMHMFVAIVRNVSIPILLFRPGSEVVSVLILNSLRQGHFKLASTMAAIIAVISIVPYTILQYRRVGQTAQME